MRFPEPTPRPATGGAPALARRATVLAAALLVVTAAAGAQHVAFTTSVSGSADLSSWPDAGGFHGLQAADRICQNRAAAGGLAGTFVAWISDSQDDAYCRAHGLTGKASANCGQASLPDDAGPWVRTDGFPVGGTLVEMSGPFGEVYVPLRLDEHGQPVTEEAYYTATNDQGRLTSTGDTCGDWTSASAGLFGGKGSSEATTRYWTQSGSRRCDLPAHLLCLEVGAGSAVAIPAASGALAFFYPPFVTGDIGGLAAADAFCRQRATDAGLPFADSYVAWLSDDTADAIDRFTYDGPWVRLDGVPVATGKADLTDGTLFAPVNLTPDGIYFSILNGGAWTATDAAGRATPSNCLGWTTDSPFQEADFLFSVAFADAGWTLAHNGLANSTRSCDIEWGLYCFAQRGDSVFADGFESGDTSRWAATFP